MKRVSFILAVLFLFTTIVASPIYALGNAETLQESTLVPVPSLANAESVSKDELDAHLKKMGFDSQEIEKMPYELKLEIAKAGGVKVPITSSYFLRIR